MLVFYVMCITSFFSLVDLVTFVVVLCPFLKLKLNEDDEWKPTVSVKL